MAAVDQVLHGLGRGGSVVDADVRHLVVAGDELAAVHPGAVVSRVQPLRAVGQGHQVDHTVGQRAGQGLQRLVVGRAHAFHVDRQQGVAGALGARGRAAHDLGVVGVSYFGHQHQEQVAAAAAERAAHGIGGKAQAGDGGLHLGPRRLCDRLAGVHHARNGRDGDACFAGDGVDGGAGAGHQGVLGSRCRLWVRIGKEFSCPYVTR